MHLLAKQLSAIDRIDLIPTRLIAQYPEVADCIAQLWGDTELEAYLLSLLMLDEQQTSMHKMQVGDSPVLVREIMRLSVAYIDLLGQIHASKDIWAEVRSGADFVNNDGYIVNSDYSHEFNGNTSGVYDRGVATIMPKKINEEEWSPLMQASFSGRLSRVLALLEKRQNLGEFDTAGYQALHLATMQNHAPIVRLLLEVGADVNAQCFRGATPLVLAAAAGHAATVNLLIEYGADINHPRRDGRTALHQAAIHGHDAVLVSLLQAGANPLLETSAGQTALSLVPSDKNRMAELLESAMPKRNMHVIASREIVYQPLIDWN